MDKRLSIVTALRDRATAGVSGVDVARWLRAELGPEASFFRFVALLHHAFDVPRERLRPLEGWTGWQAGGALGDAEAEALLTPLRPRPADFDRFALSGRQPLPLPMVFDRPFVSSGYVTSHSQLVLRSRVGDDLLDLVFLAVTAMRVHARYDGLRIATAGDEARHLADITEPYDTGSYYLRLSDDDFVACGNLQVLHNGAPHALDTTFRTAYAPLSPALTMPLRPGAGFRVWMWTGDGHDLVLRSVDHRLDLVFTAVHALQVRHLFDELTVDEAPSRDGLRHFVLTDGRHEGYVTCADLRLQQRLHQRCGPAWG